MKTNRKRILLAASLGLGALLAAPSAHAAYSVTAGGTGTGLTAAQLVDILIPANSGITVVGGSESYAASLNHNANGTVTGTSATDIANAAIGSFSGASPANGLSFASGVILSSGNIGGAGEVYEPDTTGSLPPNSSPRTSRNWFGSGSSLLDAVAGVTSHDASWLSFEFSSESSAFSFQYVFASDEYGFGQDAQNFNDAFAFVLTDLSNNNQVNLATLPFSNTLSDIVSVQNVNQVNNPWFYTDNAYGTGSYALEYDGLVGGVGGFPLFASAEIVAGRNYRIDIVIGDTADRLGDSAVFLAADSFVSEPPPENPVPEPATYVGALALGALIARRIRRK